MADVSGTQSGWGETKKKAKNVLEQEEDERLRMSESARDDADEDASDEDVSAIPDLDEQQDEDLTKQVAEAPSGNVQMATIADLDRDLGTSLPFTKTESGIDLKVLINALQPSQELAEDDREWDFVHLFTEVKSEIEAEKAAAEEKTETNEDEFGIPAL